MHFFLDNVQKQFKRFYILRVACIVLLGLGIYLGYSLRSTNSGVIPVKNLESVSREDQKMQKYRLKNGVEICYIQDRTQNHSSAAVAVQAGSWDDPETAQGIAHFTEHMLFLGSQYYPEEQGFSSHLSQYQGSTNAYTKPDGTVYFMSCSHDGFLEGLDRFCDLVAHPIFSENAMKREKHAIEEELTLKKSSDTYLAYLILGQMASYSHPARKFHIGSLDTLRSVDVDDLQRWHRQFYQPHSLKFTIISPFAASNILPILSKRLLTLQPSSPAQPSSHQQNASWLGHLEHSSHTLQRATLPSSTNTYCLQVIHPLVSLTDRYHSLGQTEIAPVISHRAPNSFYSYLHTLGWCKNFETYAYTFRNQSLLVADFDLTPQGYQNKHVIENLYRALLERYAALTSAPAYLYKEFSHMRKKKHLESPRKPAKELAYKIADHLLYESLDTYPTQTLLRSPEIFSSIPLQCRKLLQIAPTVIEILPQTVIEDEGISLDRTHPNLTTLKYALQHQAADFSIKPDTKALVAGWQLFPSRNPYINYKKPRESAHQILPPLPPQGPLVETKSLRLHYLKEQYLGGGQSHFTFRISTPLSHDHSLKSIVLEQLWLQWLLTKHSKMIEHADTAGYAIHVVPAYGDLEVHISGWTAGIKLVIEDFLKSLQLNFAQNTPEFLMAQDSLLHSFKDQQKKPIASALNTLKHNLYEQYPSMEAQLETLKKLTEQDLESYTLTRFSAVYLDILAVTSFTPENTATLANTWRNLFVSSVTSRFQQHFFPLQMQFPAKDLTFTQHSEGNTLMLFCDHGPASDTELWAALVLMSDNLHESYFSKLRTQQQMGYLVRGEVQRTQGNRCATLLYLHSGGHTVETLRNETQAFLDDYILSLPAKITVSDFRILKKSLIERLAKNPESVSAIARKLAENVFLEEAGMTSMDALVKAVHAMEYTQWLSVIKKAYSAPKMITITSTLENNPSQE